MKFKNGFRPYFDFAIFNNNEDLLFLIEYNGIQHYEFKDENNGWNNEKNFKQTQDRDQQKINMCEELNIPLEIISYISYTNLEEVVFDLLKKYQVIGDN